MKRATTKRHKWVVSYNSYKLQQCEICGLYRARPGYKVFDNPDFTQWPDGGRDCRPKRSPA